MKSSCQQLSLREQQMRELQASLHSDVSWGGREGDGRSLHSDVRGGGGR